MQRTSKNSLKNRYFRERALLRCIRPEKTFYPTLYGHNMDIVSKYEPLAHLANLNDPTGRFGRQALLLHIEIPHSRSL